MSDAKVKALVEAVKRCRPWLAQVGDGGPGPPHQFDLDVKALDAAIAAIDAEAAPVEPVVGMRYTTTSAPAQVRIVDRVNRRSIVYNVEGQKWQAITPLDKWQRAVAADRVHVLSTPEPRTEKR